MIRSAAPRVVGVGRGPSANVAAPSIQRDLEAGFADLQLAISGYVLAYVVALTIGGRRGGTKGHKQVFVTGLVAFVVM